MEGLWTRIALRVWVVLVLLFLFIPIAIIPIFALNASKVQAWPPTSLTFSWINLTLSDPDVVSAIGLSVRVALVTTAAALVLGSLAAFAIHRTNFFGKDAISFLLVLPLALPGIITAIALRSSFTFANIELSIWTIIIGHTTFCIVVVYNNVLARLRRTQGSLFEAAADLGASGFQTFRDITVPLISTALVAGAMLAFALSFDEVIVTTFTAGAQNTVPIWILAHLRSGQRLPEVNVVVSLVILVTIIPVVAAARLTGGSGAARVRAGR
ncbi:MAG TPA: ABC transporter permease [Candidatus Dormibacteraeota bacterium]|nr:ABC transporter permease [Candidatus Dormibacteraeota bacterium]